MKTFDHLYHSLIAYLIGQFFILGSLIGQDFQLKKEVSEDEIAYLQEVIQEMSETDQQYRNYIANETMDDKIIEQMNAVYDKDGIEAYMKYTKSLNLSMDKDLKDSLWVLQHQIDIKNHLTLRGIFDTYGFLPEALLGKNTYVQLLLLMHPPKDWDPAEYLEEYTVIFKEEVKAERMPPETFAKFYDNIKAKILREPQLYGTNQQFDMKTNKVLPPIIEDVNKSNKARKAIGLPLLAEGEYRLWGDQ
ncbi:MAG: hypothetical protein R8P61_04115 [Bacteroidia bacterium]|nr:hypothetical protein [Bacteroidia bacterium]